MNKVPDLSLCHNKNKQIVTRFAPSPTGFLHIGGARTALFNYLFAKHHGGKFLLRIEDTDRTRSTEAATAAILDGMKWLGLDWDDEPVYQFARSDIHAAAAKKLVNSGKAYYCFMTQEELESERAEAMHDGRHYIVKSKWRDADSSSYPVDQKPVIRLKAPRDGETVIADLVQGDVVVANDHLDDMILLRSDGTPTYMLAVVVDDHDMGVTHIIRGDDHLTNAARQIVLYNAFGWDVPQMAHIPLIHGPDGAKLSKRHGAVGIDWYRDEGYLPEAMCNYLVRLGWSHGNDEIFSREHAIEWFDLKSIGKSPSRLDWDKMRNVNMNYIKETPDEKLLAFVVDELVKEMVISEISKDAILHAIGSLKPRSHVLTEMMELAKLYVIEFDPPIEPDAAEIIEHMDRIVVEDAMAMIMNLEAFDVDSISAALKNLAETKGIKLGELMKPLRCLLTGRLNSPSVFEIIAIIGKDAALRRLRR